MIYIWVLLACTVLLFLVSLSRKDYQPLRAVTWMIFSGLLILALAFPDAGRGWF